MLIKPDLTRKVKGVVNETLTSFLILNFYYSAFFYYSALNPKNDWHQVMAMRIKELITM